MWGSTSSGCATWGCKPAQRWCGSCLDLAVEGRMHRPIRGESSSRSIAELAARQHGVVARRQLALLGLGEDAHSGHQPETKGGDFETAVLDFVERYGLPRPTMNEPLGPCFPDALWPNERVIVSSTATPSTPQDRRSRATAEPDALAQQLTELLDRTTPTPRSARHARPPTRATRSAAPWRPGTAGARAHRARRRPAPSPSRSPRPAAAG